MQTVLAQLQELKRDPASVAVYQVPLGECEFFGGGELELTNRP
jgi:hypothetical protein